MPRLISLKLHHFRNLTQVSIEPASKLNLLYGENGSGKTSLLEAISVLAHAKSFRTPKYRNLVQQDATEFTVYGQVESESSFIGEEAPVTKIGIQRNRTTKNIAKINGDKVKGAIDLAQVTPLQVIDSHSFELLEGSSSQRRKVLDWLVFHVEHNFKNVWKDYTKCIKHRNSLLRIDTTEYKDLLPWDEQIAALAQTINKCRSSSLEKLKLVFDVFIKKADVETIGDITISYYAGWKGSESSESLLTSLKAEFLRDKSIGRTSSGPHRSDFIIKVGNVPAVDVLSRGQQKSIIIALHIAQAQVFKDIHDRVPIFMLDDMMSELDNSNIKRLLGWLDELDSQLFITGVDANKFDIESMYNSNLKPTQYKLFHVKQGQIGETAQDSALKELNN